MRQARQAGSGPENDLKQLANAIGHVGSYVDGMRERVRLLEAVVDNFPGGISVFDADLNMVLCNDRLRQMLDYPDTCSPTAIRRWRCCSASTPCAGSTDRATSKSRWRSACGAPASARRMSSSARVPNGTIVEVRGVPVEGGGFVTTYFDVTEQRRSQSTIAHMAHHDALTNLPNRMLFADRLQNGHRARQAQRADGGPLLDIDGFKAVNDRLGHQNGRAVLLSRRQRLVEAVRENDTVARLGGDEFAIVQTGIKEIADAAVLARRVLGRSAAPSRSRARQSRLAVSVGIAFAPKDATSNDEILAKADSGARARQGPGGGVFSLYGATGNSSKSGRTRRCGCRRADQAGGRSACGGPPRQLHGKRPSSNNTARKAPSCQGKTTGSTAADNHRPHLFEIPGRRRQHAGLDQGQEPMSEIASIAASIFKRAAGAQRFVVAIAGPPGSGKSTLAANLHEVLPEGSSVVVPMDGFHFDDAMLEQRGMRQRKGAPETFDFAGFDTLLKRIRAIEPDIAIPVFDRSMELSRAGAAIIGARRQVRAGRGKLPAARRDAVVGARPTASTSPSSSTCRASSWRGGCCERWRKHGKSDDEARAWIAGNDMPNIDRVLAARRKADLVL